MTNGAADKANTILFEELYTIVVVAREKKYKAFKKLCRKLRISFLAHSFG
jgi:hypothetical protein